MTRRHNRGRGGRRALTNALRGCPQAPQDVYVDGTLYTTDLCPEAGCWGVLGHPGLHSDGKTRWTAKGRPVIADWAERIDQEAGGGAS